ncbi:type II secretion system protein [Armatimonas sp.]|uniref:competence type IV pilus major pilin ComGC n=1 Tax=Armatimonas sp. TaxID=1872638 RepID=UPI00286D1558|nr:type II secretion system protein [Armatimonas sp.]
MKSTVKKAFTLVEIMIVVLIIGILVAIAVPNFIKARETSRSRSCIQNLRQIESTVQQWAMTNNIPSTHPNAVVIADLCVDHPTWGNKYLKSMPICPSGGTYPNPMVNATPTCSIGTAATPAHVMP